MTAGVTAIFRRQFEKPTILNEINSQLAYRDKKNVGLEFLA